MNANERIDKAWRAEAAQLESNPLILAMDGKTFTEDHYAMLLRELYHNTHENPEGLTYMAAKLVGPQRRLNKKLFRHSHMESGHDQMAADDLATLGFDAEIMKRERALVTTEAFTAFPIFQVDRRNPIAYLAYLYHLEHVAEVYGPKIVGYLRGIGIPLEAMTFLVEHAEADVAHNKLNEEYIRELVTTEADLQAYLYGLRGVARLHASMLQGVMESVDQDWPEWTSLKATRKAQAKRVLTHS